MSNTQILIYAGLVCLGWILRQKFGPPVSPAETKAPPQLTGELVQLLKQALQQNGQAQPPGTPATIPVCVELHPIIKTGGTS